MNNYSTIFERILFIIHQKGIKNVAELADSLGYASPQKIYRLKQPDCKPSYDILLDLSNKFEDLNLRWFITGEGNAFVTAGENSASLAAEPLVTYRTGEIENLNSRIAELEIEKKSLLLALREVGWGNKDKGLL